MYLLKKSEGYHKIPVNSKYYIEILKRKYLSYNESKELPWDPKVGDLVQLYIMQDREFTGQHSDIFMIKNIYEDRDRHAIVIEFDEF